VVGVVGNVHYEGIAGSHDAVYEPLARGAPRTFTLLVKTRADARTALNALRATVESLDAELVLTEVVMAQRISDEFTDPRRRTAVVASFAIVGVLLAALGIFGLMSFVVRERRRELGVRIALGARPQLLTQLIVTRGLRHALIGTVLGLGIAAFEARWLGSLLYGVQASDPVMIALAAASMLVVAAAACWVPGLRAAKIKPADVLQ
jgi:ABC-type antimicrobial peptide transport system permease subunit